jgi:hypothetical protein
METQNFFKSKQFKILFILAVTIGLIIIARAGYDFGQWLQHVLN